METQEERIARLENAMASLANLYKQIKEENIAAEKRREAEEKRREAEEKDREEKRIADQKRREAERIAAEKRREAEEKDREEKREAERAEQKRRDEEYKQEVKAERRAWNKQRGDLARQLGTVVEDIVAPNIPRIATEDFGWKEIIDFGPRRKVRSRKDRSKRREFDVIAIGENAVIVNETKLSPKIGDVDDFLKVLDEIVDYFPEAKGKEIIAIFASLNLEEGLIAYLTKQEIYAMTMGDENMELVNFEQVFKEKN